MSVVSPPQPASPVPGIFSSYQRRAGVFDELQEPGDSIRSHWQPIVDSVERLGREGLSERLDTARRLLSEHGVTYNVYADGASDERIWELDLLPLVISAADWERLATGLIQRTRLLNLVLADLYGPQRLIHDGLLPPALLQANPGFLRTCHGIRPPKDQFLSLHAVDLTRAPNGQWWVLSDRTQAPSGIGYALENRIIISRLLSDEFRSFNVERVAPFFAARKEGLRSIAPWTDSPTIVLLTPGPLTETYFEHAYLARYLGYPLVEGNDLTVRDRFVYIKTLEGLQRVDVIIRRVDDTFCDPLELRPDSFLGVPGLVEAARAGNVAISNALGSGAVEAPALLAFLPALSRHLLGEELRIPNAATWWCGQKREREYALRNLHKLVIKRGFVGGPIEPQFGEALTSESLAALARRIQANPHAYLGQERVALSTTPVWTGAKFEPRPMILRCYICATPDGFAVLPGGLTRVSASPDSPIVSSKYGGSSKDTWVLSERPVEEFSLLDSSGRPAPSDRPDQVPSRAAENLFWLGRYAERLESATRLLRTALARLSGEGGASDEKELVAIVRCLVALDQLPARFAVRASRQEVTTALSGLIYGSEPWTVRDSLRRVSYLTARVRDRLSGDTWRILNQLQTEFPATAQSSSGAMLSTLHRLIFQLAALAGMELENMTRGHGWRFLDVGRRLERGKNLLSTIIAMHEAEPGGETMLAPLLEYTDSSMSYRRQHFARPELPTTLEFLLTETNNPRALAFQMKSLRHHLTRLPDASEDSAERQKFESLATALAAADFPLLGARARNGDTEELLVVLQDLDQGFWELSDLLSSHYFSHARAHNS